MALSSSLITTRLFLFQDTRSIIGIILLPFFIKIIQMMMMFLESHLQLSVIHNNSSLLEMIQDSSHYIQLMLISKFQISMIYLLLQMYLLMHKLQVMITSSFSLLKITLFIGSISHQIKLNPLQILQIFMSLMLVLIELFL